MKECCAVFGASSDEEVFYTVYYGLYALQHRGQESAGIATWDEEGGVESINIYKDMGLIFEAFKYPGKYDHLKGTVGIGHVRYSTTGESGIENAQPLLINYAKGSFVIAHNGNLTNSEELKEELARGGSTFTTTTDSEIIAKLIAQEHRDGDMVDAIKNAMKRLEGSYCLVMIYEGKLMGIRDPHGFRPLVLGRKDNTYVIASESCALDALNIPLLRDVEPSEIVVIEGDKISSFKGARKRISHCVFEYIYFSRADSIINGISVYDVRKRLGQILAREAPVEGDIVAAVPESGITAAIGYAMESGIPYGEAMIKNRYAGRTFIMPSQSERDEGVRVKLNPIANEVKDKRIILVDDSIVRGSTSRRLIKLLKNNGAKEVHMRVSSPPIRYPCYYGIDMQTKGEFIARKFDENLKKYRPREIEEIRKIIGVDSLAYISLEGLVEAIGLPKEKLCLACLNGEYPIKKKIQTRL
ncbi:MAG: amidophosphoribosyltransferase [Candidatus Altiarchaeales archaeon WOR_SM1_86-2]|nr:MAG: amidophosphoribosyltransferase [Candidatus Altiarchaeales archaeon WOR_SM1_79]ODS39120.1 MAG: amidophosphoribosyltransferase [Candidatus Altiarchaeales archaeon WOR_SM1_86-2]